MNDIEELGKMFKQFRRDARLTQVHFSTISGIPVRTLIRMEAGDQSVAIGTYMRAARTLDAKLIVSRSSRTRPTLDEVHALYREEDAGDEPASSPTHLSRR